MRGSDRVRNLWLSFVLGALAFRGYLITGSSLAVRSDRSELCIAAKYTELMGIARCSSIEE